MALRTVLVPLTLLFAIGVGWGLGVIFAKYGGQNGIAPVGYLFWVALGGGVVAMLICWLRGTFPKLSREHLRYYLLTAILRTASANLIFYTVVQHIPAGVMSVVLGTSPLFTYGLSLSFRMEKFNQIRLGGLLLGLAGVALFVLPRGSLPDPSMAGWVLAGFAAPILYAVANIFIDRQRPKTGDSITFAVGMLWGTAILILPLAIYTGDFYVPALPLNAADWVLFTHMLIAGVAFYGLFELIRMSGPTYASQLTYVVTLTGIVVGIFVFDEIHSIWIWAGTAMVLSGVGLVNIRTKRSA